MSLSMGHVSSDEISVLYNRWWTGDSVEFIVVVVGLSSGFYADFFAEYLAALPVSSDSHVVTQVICERSSSYSCDRLFLVQK